MVINCGLVNLTMVGRSRVKTAGGEAALAAILVSALVKAQLASLTQVTNSNCKLDFILVFFFFKISKKNICSIQF